MVFTAFAAIAVAVASASAPSPSSEINSCKYLSIANFSEDPYGIATELRRQGSAQGFAVIASPADVTRSEIVKLCIMSGSWSAGGASGNLNMRVTDAISGAVIAEVAGGATNWWGMSRTVKAGVSKIYAQLHYTGFTEAALQSRIQRLYPTRPKLAISEETVRTNPPHSEIEGVWADPKDEYRIAIVPSTSVAGADYVAVVLRSIHTIWEPGEIKAEIRKTASPAVFTATYFPLSKQAAGTTLTVEGVTLHGSTTANGVKIDVMYMRVWPAVTSTPTANAPPATGRAVSGTGFIATKSGLIATNWHVVQDAHSIDVTFPGSKQPIPVEVVIRDPINDLAILRPMGQPSRGEGSCSAIPFQLIATSAVTLGTKVSTIGYPLQSILGTSPKFSEGVVSSRSGLQDDPRTFQISAAVQPGSSGGPLFDDHGNVIGVIVATLDAARLYADAGALPQNVNWAIKADYLLNLIAMLPNEHAADRTTPFSAEAATACIGLINAR